MSLRPLCFSITAVRVSSFLVIMSVFTNLWFIANYSLCGISCQLFSEEQVPVITIYIYKITGKEDCTPKYDQQEVESGV